MDRRNSSSLKTFQPLQKSISLGQGRRNSVALRADYSRSLERLNEILQAKQAEQQNLEEDSKIKRGLRKVHEKFEFAQTSANQLPRDPLPWQRCCHAFRLPPHALPGRWTTGLITLMFIYFALYSIFKDKAAPPMTCSFTESKNNTSGRYCSSDVFGLFVLISSSMISGAIIKLCHLPPLLGMLLTGLVIGNIPAIDVSERISKFWFPLLRKLALGVILTRAGLCLDPATLKRLSAAVFRLAFIPCLIEACTCALTSHLILGYDVQWGFMLGFVLGAVSPAVVVLSMLKLEERGYGVEKGVPTLVIAAASMDDVLAITGHSFVLGMALPRGDTSTNKMWNIAKGPLEALAGICYGIILGVILWYFPNKKHKRFVLFRCVLLLSGGIAALLGSHLKIVKLPGAGAVGCLTLSFIAGLGWRRRDKWVEEANPVIPVVDTLWWIAEPTLFSLIGSEIKFKKIFENGEWLAKALSVVFIGLGCRMCASFLVVTRIGLDFKEKLFVAIAWIPKATVQAAIGPSAKDTALSTLSSIDPSQREMVLKNGDDIMIIGALVILITAPLGALLIGFLGPKLLKQENMDIVMSPSTVGVIEEENRSLSPDEDENSFSMSNGPVPAHERDSQSVDNFNNKNKIYRSEIPDSMSV